LYLHSFPTRRSSDLKIAENIGVVKPTIQNVNQSKKSAVLSLENTIFLPNTLKVGVLVTTGFDGDEVQKTLEALKKQGVFYEIIRDRKSTRLNSSHVS